MSARYDIVVYGATGFTGVYVVKVLATAAIFKGKSIAVAGRNEEKLRAVLEDVFQETGNDVVRKYPIIVADSSKDESLNNMARQARVIINTVGPYIIHGEAVVRAAVNNSASHLDISGEPAFLERMEQRYGKMAKDKGVYIVGACGFDSIPSDLGTDFLKRHFDGTLAWVETCFRLNRGPAGYSLNTGTMESIMLGIKSIREGGAAALHRSVMPEPLPEAKFKAPCRCPMTKIREPALNAWALPFPGSDKSIIERSQYYDYHTNGMRPILVYTYFTIGSFCKSVHLAIWLGIFSFFSLFGPTRRFISNHPEGCSFGIFKKSGPTTQQIKEASFDYYFFGTGWPSGEIPDKSRPTKKVAARCHGPDVAYTFTSASICCAALALLNDRENLPRGGGVFTTASAFRGTRIYEYMRTLGVSFEIISSEKREGSQLV
ncbi:hypothetical protein PMAYCL1PPCAC_32114 [Pristionchus mayeri]|uniref:Saccharopine dehydrogenase NADP binding domain-containing protein n=1 Tax=Pristionchus mayeri TaxID=1317129 RepID=A0AAN5IER5_9BILA|nr:hypothetical protein PMAYCL1PPCAC_32114 [Pristionchus mayeri]